jgi:hypothetical protein
MGVCHKKEEKRGIIGASKTITKYNMNSFKQAENIFSYPKRERKTGSNIHEKGYDITQIQLRLEAENEP